MRRISLTCIAGPLKGQLFELNGGPAFIFGRYPKAHVNMGADPAASHLHFIVDVSGNAVRVADLGSTNGLVINDRHYGGKIGEPLQEFVGLGDGDTILAGASLFRLNIQNVDSRVFRELQPPAGSASRHGGNGLTEIIPPGILPADPDATIDRQPVALPRIDGYTILEKIGGGGKGVVYRAVKDDTGASAAIKLVQLDRNKGKKQRTLDMFRREIDITRQLQHPHVIRYLGDGVSQGSTYLALEYVDGGTLDSLIHSLPEGRMNMPQAVPLFLQLLEAVAYMHGLSLVHRDIKPKNILLDLRRGGSFAVKLSDMGLACRSTTRDAADDFLPIVSEGGTPAYMPPEQLTDLTRALPQSDVFSSAATFYQMVTGSLLYDFAGKEQNQAIIDGHIKPILHLRPDLPMGVANVVSKALSYAPENRYANAQEMLIAFQQSLG